MRGPFARAWDWTMGRVYLLAWFGLSLLGACSLDTVGTRAEPGNDASVGGSGNLGGVGASGGGFPDAATGGTAGTTGGTGGLAGSGGVGATGGSGGVDAGGGMGGVAGSGGAPVWKPSDIADCVLWLDGSDTATIKQSGASVTEWNDKCGPATATSSGGKAPNLTTIDGKQGVRCDGADDILTLDGPAVVAGEFSLFFVVSKPTEEAGHTALWSNRNESAAANGTTMYLGFDGSRALVYQSALSPPPISSPPFKAPFAIGIFEYVSSSSGAGELLLNGTVEATRAASSLAATKLRVGTLCGDTLVATAFGAYDIFEVIAYDRKLNDAERAKVRSELTTKWGL